MIESSLQVSKGDAHAQAKYVRWMYANLLYAVMRIWSKDTFSKH